MKAKARGASSVLSVPSGYDIPSDHSEKLRHAPPSLDHSRCTYHRNWTNERDVGASAT